MIDPDIAEQLQYFNYAHLPSALQEVSKPFHDLAHSCAQQLGGQQLRLGLQRLLEAKDCMVRAAVRK